ncbi:hypothetical protein TWF106_001496 [Orbilia oligospora]|uniref:Uncharacterized protein n=1 Tax=Orbilia oligospora TaxID=2813651 RepID=A0A6G1LSL4_ORBOL|nr:hypothetical protein TWF679_002574 [Orbilia oligospora]KAF3204613.1 hypothetical protein TWF106_001496 [Orbilia oligospora]KAF3205887.1 hypothetical protein TWF191_001589 [Orbilia oligospora]KAF3233365.1 hypothetical protein TWF192_002396 [Orbilia oligospora]
MVSTRSSSRGSNKPVTGIGCQLSPTRGQQCSSANGEHSHQLPNAASQAQNRTSKSQSSKKSSQAQNKTNESQSSKKSSQAQNKTNKSQSSKKSASIEPAAPRRSARLSGASPSQASLKVLQSPEELPPTQHRTIRKIPTAKSEPAAQKAKSGHSRKRPFTEPLLETPVASTGALHQQAKAPKEPSSGERPTKKARTASPEASLPQAAPPNEPQSPEAVAAEIPSAALPPRTFRLREKAEDDDECIGDTLIQHVWTQTVYRKWADPEWLAELRGRGITKMSDLPGFDGKGGISRFKLGVQKFFEEELDIGFEREWKKQVDMMRNVDLKWAIDEDTRMSFHYGWQEEMEDEDEDEDEEEEATTSGTTAGKRRRSLADKGGPLPKRRRVLLNRETTPEYIQPDRSLGKQAMKKLGEETRRVLDQVESFLELFEEELCGEGEPSFYKTRLQGVEQRLEELGDKLQKMSEVMGGLNPRLKVQPGRKWGRKTSVGVPHP